LIGIVRCIGTSISYSLEYSLKAIVKMVTHFFSKHDVIIEINEPSRESRNAMEVGLNCRRTEGGKVRFVWKNLFVAYLWHKPRITLNQQT